MTGSPKILPWSGVLAVCQDRGRGGQNPLLFTNGVFDLLHPGHVSFLEAAAARGPGILVVGVNSDASVRRLKGPARPLQCLEDRMQMLAALEVVRLVTAFDEDDAGALIQFLRPEVYLKADSYARERLPEAPIVEGYGGQVALLPMKEGYSTTGLVRRICTTYGLPVPVGRLRGPLAFPGGG